MLKSLTLASIAGLTLAAAAPAFADHRHHGRGYGHYNHAHRAPARVIVQRPVYVPARPVVVYRQPVVVHRPVYVQPAPVVHRVDPHVGLGILIGAAVGAVIAHNAAY